MATQDHALPPGWQISASPSQPHAVADGITIWPTDDVLVAEFAPHARWPETDHHTATEVLDVRRGSLHLGLPDGGDVVVEAGQQARALAGTHHTPYAGPDGCLLTVRYESTAPAHPSLRPT